MLTPNLDSLPHQGEFHARKPGAEPLAHGGHKPGVKVGKSAIPEFKAEVYAPGTAPIKDTFKPNPESKVLFQGQNDVATAQTDPLDSLPGATSDYIHKETKFGKRVYGETSNEAHAVRAQRRTGVGGHLLYGQSTDTGDGSIERKVRAVGADLEGRAAEMKGQRGKSGAVEGGLNWPGAESAEPVSAEHLAAEL